MIPSIASDEQIIVLKNSIICDIFFFRSLWFLCVMKMCWMCTCLWQCYKLFSLALCMRWYMYSKLLMEISLHEVIRHFGHTPGHHFSIKTIFPDIGILIVKIRLFSDCLIFIMGIPLLVIWHFRIETTPWWSFKTVTCRIMVVTVNVVGCS